MATGGGQDGRRYGRTGRAEARRPEWPRFGRRSVLAVSLSLLTLLSVLAVPGAGAAPAGSGAVASVDDGAGGADPLAKGGSPAGKGGGNSSSGGGSSSSSGSSGSGSSSGGAGPKSGGGSGSSSSSAGSESGSGGGGQNGQANTKGKSKGQNPGAGQRGAPNGPGDVGVDVDVGSLPGVERKGKSNGGGPPDGAGPPDGSKGSGNGNGGQGPPESAPGSAPGGPSVSVSTGPPARPGSERAGVTSDGAAPTSVVGVEVRNARAGDRIELDVSPSAVEGDAVAFEGVSLTVKRGGGFTMEVSNSRGRLPGSPAFEPDQAADSLGRVRLDHSIANEEVEGVSYTFRVSKAHLRSTDTDPEDVALFRYADGGWSELPTDVVGETESHYLLESASPGMSEFAIGAKRPDFETFWADVEAHSVDAGETVTVRGRVTNDGGADGVYDARLVVDGETVAERSITIAAGGTRQINFRTELDRTGAKRISINGVAAGEVTVAEPPEGSGSDGTDPTLAVLVDRLLEVGHTLGITSPPSSDAG